MTGPTVGRITTRTAFAELQRSRARGSSGVVRATFVPARVGDSGVFPQVGYAIGTHCGPAVTRNRLRRRAREVVRSEASSLPRGRYLLRIAPGAATAERSEFRADVVAALQRAARTTRAPEGSVS